MEYQHRFRWENIERIGSGGQGVVYRVFDKNRFDIEKSILPSVVRSIPSLTGLGYVEGRKLAFDEFVKCINDIVQLQDMSNHAALKELHQPADARDFEHAEARLRREIEAMQRISHPHLLEILDTDPDLKWHVSNFHSKGTLANHIKNYTGNLLTSLRSLRPLVSGVAELHKNGIVHRDIKPLNIFMGDDGQLILGDFGLVFFTDQGHTRLSGTFENVGSTDWMPGWASRMRIEDVRPTFDVYSLGKVLWAMVSGLPILRREYFTDPEFNLEELFQRTPSMKLANKFFDKCIVEREVNCLKDASALLAEMDNLIEMIEGNFDLIDPSIKRKCRVCGIGSYDLRVNQDPTQARNYGFPASGTRTYKIFACSNCGNVQLFLFGDSATTNAWT